MKHPLALSLATIALGGVLLAGVGRWAAPKAVAEAAPAAPPAATVVGRGRYLATAADCIACHTAPFGKPYAGGLAFKLPFGVMYSTNITPDRATGIGAYSDEDFVRALQKGVRRDGHHLYPSMPYASLTGVSRDDALAIKAYLFSLPAVRAPARPPTFGFPFNQRWGLAIWDALFLKDRRFEPDPRLNAQQNRGAYLVTVLGHCGECHTPRNFAFALDQGRQLAGAELQGWRAFNITSDKSAGIGGWSDRALADYLSTGRSDGHGAANGPMAEAVSHSLQYLTPQDRDAIVAYLRTVRPQPGTPPQPAVIPASLDVAAAWTFGPKEPPASLGRRLFEGACAGCHAWNGGAQAGSHTPLAGARAVSDPTGLNVVQAVLKGANPPMGGQSVYMPAFANGMSDVEVAAVANYVIAHFGGPAGRVTPDQVRKARGEF
jgi:mono/diheme cytochrome c family protein